MVSGEIVSKSIEWISTKFENSLSNHPVWGEVRRVWRKERDDSYARNAVEARRGRQKEKPINFTMANSETVATPFLQFTEVIKV